MPKPTHGETQEEYMGRCIPMLIDEGKDRDQAAAICHSMWEAKKAIESLNVLRWETVKREHNKKFVESDK